MAKYFFQIEDSQSPPSGALITIDGILLSDGEINDLAAEFAASPVGSLTELVGPLSVVHIQELDITRDIAVAP